MDKEKGHLSNLKCKVVLHPSYIYGLVVLAVLALATVFADGTVANAKTANPNS